MSFPYAFNERVRSFARHSRCAEIGLRLPVLNLCAALWLLVLLNVPFWRALWQAAGGWDASRAGFLLSLPLFVLLWVWLILECLTWGRAAKPVLAMVLLLSAATAYFMSVYGVVFDRTMIANIAETDPAEALSCSVHGCSVGCSSSAGCRCGCSRACALPAPRGTRDSSPRRRLWPPCSAGARSSSRRFSSLTRRFCATTTSCA